MNDYKAVYFIRFRKENDYYVGENVYNGDTYTIKIDVDNIEITPFNWYILSEVDNDKGIYELSTIDDVVYIPLDQIQIIKWSYNKG